METLKILDKFGPAVKIKIKGSDSYKTSFGLALTIIYAILGVLTFVAFGRDIIEKKLPSVTFNREITTEAEFNLTSENYFVAFYNQFDNSDVEDFERKFHIYMQVFYNYASYYTEEKYFFQKCQNDTISKKEGLIVRPELYYCLPPGTKIKSTGVYGDKNMFVSVRTNVDFCINGVDNRTNCISKETTVKNMKNIVMHVLLDDYFTNSNNYLDPFNKYYYSEQIIGQAGVFTRQNVEFKTINYKTDQGFILESIETDIKSSIDNYNIQNLVNPNTNTIFSNLYRNSKLRDVYNRSYIKIQGVFALIGGLLTVFNKALDFICSYFVYPDIIQVFYEKYKSKEKKENFNSNFPNFESQINLNNYINNNSKLPNSLNIDKNLNINTFKYTEQTNENTKFSEKIFIKNKVNTFKSSKMQLDFNGLTIKEKVLRACCIKPKVFNDKFKTYNSIVNLYQKKFSLEHLMKVSKRVKILNHIIFEDFQRKLLSYINLPKSKFIGTSFDELFKELQKNLEENMNSSNNIINSKILMYLEK
jgi:hypothetical protein